MSTASYPNLQINAETLKSHVIFPSHVHNITTDRGLTERQARPEATALATSHIPAHLNPNGFAQALHAALKSSVVGYVMQLHQHGNLIETLQWNWAQTPADSSEGWNPQIPMHVASLSKVITAMATTKVLLAKGISFDAAILPYLPHYWQKGPHVDTVTFRQLLTHTSGFTSGGADFLSVKAQVAIGIGLLKKYQYANSNFLLCRVLLPVLVGDVPVNAAPFPPFNDQYWDIVTIQSYENYVTKNIFAPAGSTGTFAHAGGDALAYTNPTTAHGWNSGDLSSVSGAAGWHFSVGQLLKIMGAFRRGGSILSPAQAQAMLDNQFGIDFKLPRPIDGALIYSKNGSWSNGNGQTEQCVAFFLPEDMELVLLVNSPVVAKVSFLENVVFNAYDANVKP